MFSASIFRMLQKYNSSIIHSAMTRAFSKFNIYERLRFSHHKYINFSNCENLISHQFTRHNVFLISTVLLKLYLGPLKLSLLNWLTLTPFESSPFSSAQNVCFLKNFFCFSHNFIQHTYTNTKWKLQLEVERSKLLT